MPEHDTSTRAKSVQFVQPAFAGERDHLASTVGSASYSEGFPTTLGRIPAQDTSASKEVQPSGDRRRDPARPALDPLPTWRPRPAPFESGLGKVLSDQLVVRLPDHSQLRSPRPARCIDTML